MPILGVIRTSAYFDSVALMLAQREARELPGVEEAGVVMATDANKALLRDSGLDFPGLAGAGPDDLAIVARAATRAQADAAVARVQEALIRRRTTSGAGGDYRPKTIASARRQLPDATLALISVPGRFARPVVLEALDEGLHVLLFSDNVPIEHEIELKRRSRERGLLLMGPDCGTAIIGGAALGFANDQRRTTNDCLLQIRHLHRRQRGFESFIAHLQPGAVDGLLQSVAGEHAEGMRHASLLRRLPDATRDFVDDDVVVSGVSAQQTAETDDGVVFPGFGKGASCGRDFK